MFVDVYFCSSELLARALQPLSDVSMCVCVFDLITLYSWRHSLQSWRILTLRPGSTSLSVRILEAHIIVHRVLKNSLFGLELGKEEILA